MKINDLLEEEKEGGSITYISSKKPPKKSFFSKIIKNISYATLISSSLFIGANALAVQKETIDTYTKLHELKDSIQTNSNVEINKANFEKSLNTSLKKLEENLRQAEIINIENIKIASFFILDSIPNGESLLAFASPKEQAIVVAFSANNKRTHFNTFFSEDPSREFGISNEKMFEFIFLHELGHLQHSKQEIFKSSALPNTENSSLNYVFKKSSQFIFDNPQNIISGQNNYTSLLLENYADSFAVLSYLKLNNFSKESIQDIEKIKEIRTKNSLTTLENHNDKYKSKIENFIDSYSTSHSIDFILNNIEKYKKIEGKDIKEIALEISSTVVFQLINNNQNNSELDVNLDKPIFEKIKEINQTNTISSITDNIKRMKLKFNMSMQEPNTSKNYKPI